MKLPPLLCALLLCLRVGAAEIPRTQPPGTLPDDPRLGPLKELDGYFPFTPAASREAWSVRAEQVRMQMRVALGLWPEPTRTPLNAVIHGRIEQEDYTVEKVYFESMPGLFVTGNIYRPKGKTGPFPAVLCPHGHWNDARFALRTDAEMKKELESGGEKLPESNRSMFQSIGVQLARMGIVAFVYDMLGYCDSQQLSYEVAHKFARQRPEMNTREFWGLFSPQAEAHAQSIMGLQTWNSMRALDFLTALPDVDAKRLGCTGASGGGTQTQMLAALDPRLTVACPAVMPSTAMQGGCTCENASLLRVGTGNIEFAALFAPKAQGMTAANDWTKELATKGFPELQKHYALMGAPDHVALWARLEFGHNYNTPTREKIYAWFNQHFALGLAESQLMERDFPLLSRAQLTVWDAEHPAPEGGPDFERWLLRWWHDDAEKQLANSAAEFTKIASAGWSALIGPLSPRPAEITNARTFEIQGKERSYRASVHTRVATDHSSALPEIIIEPPMFGGITVLWLSELGKAGLFNADGTLRSQTLLLLEAGIRVVGVDLLGQGEFRADGKAIFETRKSKNPREAACFTFGYNSSLFAQRVRDVCTVLRGLQAENHGSVRALVALDGTGPIAAAALAVFPGVEAAAIETGGFRFGDVLGLQQPNFLPAAVKYGDLPGALAVAARDPRQAPRLILLGEGAALPPVVETAYRAIGRPGLAKATDKRMGAAGLTGWLLKSRKP